MAKKKRKKPRIKVQSAKAKGRMLQKLIAEKIGDILKIPVGKGEVLLSMIKDIPVYKPPVPPTSFTE